MHRICLLLFPRLMIPLPRLRLAIVILRTSGSTITYTAHIFRVPLNALTLSFITTTIPDGAVAPSIPVVDGMGAVAGGADVMAGAAAGAAAAGAADAAAGAADMAAGAADMAAGAVAIMATMADIMMDTA